MATKKISYMKLLKEAIQEFDTSKNVDVKGPFLDPILSYKGDGELPTHKDAASILERYYFEQDQDKGIDIQEHVDNEIDEVAGGDKDDVGETMDQFEEEITEQEEVEDKDEEDKEEDKEEEDKEEVSEQEEIDEETPDEDLSESEQLENAVLEKLIAEMEEEGDEGEGTKAAGTGDAEKEIPDRKQTPAETGESDDKLKEQEDVEDLDVDEELEVDEEELEEKLHPSIPTGGEEEDMGEIQEVFQIFKEQIEEDEEDEEEKEEVVDVKSDDVQV